MRGWGLAVLVAVLTACGSPGEDAATRTATDFYTAVAQGDGAAACRALAERTVSELEQSAQLPCAEAILEESILEVGDPLTTRVYGSMAQLQYAGETVFLSRYDDGWKVMAADCERIEMDRYDCQVNGG